MSHKNVNRAEDDYKSLSQELDSGIGAYEEEFNLPNDNESEDASINELEERVEKLKNDVKNLKKIKKQQEKLGKLEGKKLEILKDIQREQDREKKTKDRHGRRKRK